MSAAEKVPPMQGEKRGEARYWPTAAAYEVAGQQVPNFIKRRDREAEAAR